jgi:hypothetical protein
MRKELLICMFLVGGCGSNAHYGLAGTTSSGSAVAPPGFGASTINGVKLYDRGGILTRAFLVGVGLLAAYGSVSQSDKVIDSGPGYTVVERTTTVDVEGVKAATAVTAGALDSRSDASFLETELTVADPRLGGDTKGYMLQANYVAGFIRFGFGFGHYAFSPSSQMSLRDGQTTKVPNVPSEYSYLGFPLRLFVFRSPQLQVYGQADLNLWTLLDVIGGDPLTPSPWRFGARVQFSKFFASGELSWSRAVLDRASIGAEVGIVF